MHLIHAHMTSHGGIAQVTVQEGKGELGSMKSSVVTLLLAKSFPKMTVTPLTGNDGLTPMVTGPTTKLHRK